MTIVTAATRMQIKPRNTAVVLRRVKELAGKGTLRRAPDLLFYFGFEISHEDVACAVDHLMAELNA